jgi:hypothetical protein
MPTADEIIALVNKLAQTKVLVGIPSTNIGRDDAVNNALLGYIHEMGSPANNIPARPFLRPGITNSRDKWQPYLEQAAAAALQGNDGLMDRALNAAGTVAVSAVKNTITAKIPPPLKPATVRARRRHHGQPATAADIAGATPLVDTGQLLNSITYVVVDG